MPPENERMARVEEKYTALLAALVEIGRDLREDRKERRMLEQHIAALSEAQARTAKDVIWIRRIGAAAWAALAGYIHLK
jgi:hypothetical protein